MKTCPTCNRTFDDSFSFCLDDGSPLYFENDETKTLIQVNEDKLYYPQVNNFWKYLSAVLVLLLISILFLLSPLKSLIFKDRNENNKTAESTNHTTNQNLTDKPNSVGNSSLNNVAQDMKAMPAPTITPVKERVKTDSDQVPKLKQGMSYAAARKMLINSGWQGIIGSPNSKTFFQYDYIANKLGYYEVDDCSGTGLGLCRFLFTNQNNKRLVIVTANNEVGKPIVNRWFFEK
jgi:hypothetical protein